MVQMISHGFVSGAMFSCVGVLYDRMHSRRIADYGGVVNVMPWFATFAMLFFMANAACRVPAVSLASSWSSSRPSSVNPWIALGAATTLIIGAAYTLWLYKRIFFGEVANSHVAELKDINGREWLVLGVFAIRRAGPGHLPQAADRPDGALDREAGDADRIQQAAVIPGFDDDHLAAAAIDRR